MKLLMLTAISLQAALILSGCGPSEKQKAQWAEHQRIECLDKICEGDVLPKIGSDEFLMKLNGRYFSAPRRYTSGMSGLAFYWPSKTPITGRPDGSNYPERGKNFPDVAIEIFLRSNNIPAEPHGYRLIELAQTQGWIADRKTLRPGLDAITMKHMIGPQDQYIDRVTYYVATQLKGLDGLPPVATCNHDHPTHGGGTGFMWQPGIWAGTRMNQKHCADWPEIYLEITRVLEQLRKA